jgi:hypothetical protein
MKFLKKITASICACLAIVAPYNGGIFANTSHTFVRDAEGCRALLESAIQNTQEEYFTMWSLGFPDFISPRRGGIDERSWDGDQIVKTHESFGTDNAFRLLPKSEVDALRTLSRRNSVSIQIREIKNGDKNEWHVTSLCFDPPSIFTGSEPEGYFKRRIGDYRDNACIKKFPFLMALYMGNLWPVDIDFEMIGNLSNLLVFQTPRDMREGDFLKMKNLGRIMILELSYSRYLKGNFLKELNKRSELMVFFSSFIPIKLENMISLTKIEKFKYTLGESFVDKTRTIAIKKEEIEAYVKKARKTGRETLYHVEPGQLYWGHLAHCIFADNEKRKKAVNALSRLSVGASLLLLVRGLGYPDNAWFVYNDDDENPKTVGQKWEYVLNREFSETGDIVTDSEWVITVLIGNERIGGRQRILEIRERKMKNNYKDELSK